MTEAAQTHPSQRHRIPPNGQAFRFGRVRSLFQAALVAGLVGLSATAATGEEYQSASLADEAPQTGQTRATIFLPSVLQAADVLRYRQIFALQTDGQWAAADKLIAATDNKILLGHVQAQRYLHPRYRSHYTELSQWLKLYGDHPDAARLYDLALRRKPSQAAQPAPPRGHAKPPQAGLKVGAAEPPAERWNAALDAFRQKRYAAAAKQFEAVAKLPRTSPWIAAAGAFWAARAHLMAGQPQQVTAWLQKAAHHPLTFYGLLAREALGLDEGVPLRDPDLHYADGRALTGQPAGARAVALLQIGEARRAEPELAAVTVDSPALARAVVALANYGNMPALSLRVGNLTKGLAQAEHDAAIYPVPGWQPPEGFSVDRALVYAIIRRESSFNPGVRNTSGAAGLMQLMPATAKALAGRPLPAEKLVDPETNISLGQRYVSRLLADGAVSNNLILLAASYNAGPGNLAKWRRQANDDDPLLFIESLPARETRIFIASILTDYWIYRMRLGQDTPSLTALASGQWPMYAAQDDRSQSVAAIPSTSSADARDARH